MTCSIDTAKKWITESQYDSRARVLMKYLVRNL